VGHEDNGPSKSHGMKMADQLAGYESDKPSKSQGMKLQDSKMLTQKIEGMKLEIVL